MPHATYNPRIGASPAKLPSTYGSRRCISVLSTRRALLPASSQQLGSQSNLLYAIPSDCVDLYNQVIELDAQVAEEEARVLAALNAAVHATRSGLAEVQEAVAKMDVAVARARHAVWCGGIPVNLVSESAVTQVENGIAGGGTAKGWVGGEDGIDPDTRARLCIHLPSVCNPVLLEPHLAPLPPAPNIVPPSLDCQVKDYLSPPTDLYFGRNPRSQSDTDSGWTSSEETSSEEEGSDEEEQDGIDAEGDDGPVTPRGVAWCVPKPTHVVTITGPNTGGKTVALKTLGLAVTMAKQGMCVPSRPCAGHCEADKHANANDSNGSGEGDGVASAAGGVHAGSWFCPWFDRVFVDVGDAQDMQQSLSTFSGHIMRIQRIMDAATSHSLVLLDELGSGTDPTEGSLLGGALVEQFRQQVRMVVASTHLAALKKQGASADSQGQAHRIWEGDISEYANVAMGFDVARLRPTYELIWGQVGEANALEIARQLGFDGEVVAAARELLGGTDVVELQSNIERSEELYEQLNGDIEHSKTILTAEKAQLSSDKSTADVAKEKLSSIAARLGSDDKVSIDLGDDGALVNELDQISRHLGDRLGAGQVVTLKQQEQLQEQQAKAVELAKALRARLPAVRATLREVEDRLSLAATSSESYEAAQSLDVGYWEPSAGDKVAVPMLGDVSGHVHEVRREKGQVALPLGEVGLTYVKSSEAIPQLEVVEKPRQEQQKAQVQQVKAGTKQLLSRYMETREERSALFDKSAVRQRPQESKYVSNILSTATTTNTLDVRLMSIEELGFELERKIEELKVARQNVMYVVHGRGTGMRRQQVNDILSNTPNVAEYYLCKETLGGRTIVKFEL